MITVKVTLPKPFLTKVRQSPEQARVIFANKVDRDVQPTLEKEAQKRLGKAPGPVVHPFQFTGDEFEGGKLVRAGKSRRWYFANRVSRGSRGGSYARKDVIEKGWRVNFDRRLKDGQLVIRNIWPASGYVYGPGNPLASFRQVPGHRNTGWGRGFEAEFAYLRRYGVDLLRTAWRQSVKESLK